MQALSRFVWLRLVLALFLTAINASAAATGVSRDDVPPKITREFRGAWVATVGNIDWPSKPGLPVEQQKAELVRIFETAQELKLNAIIFQIRTSCDAVYASRIEPWSEYLTGTMGKDPGYDPLDLAIKLAHERGMELHAWFNPYRARYHSAISPVAASHISKTRPQLVRNYGRHLWLDPADKRVREYTTSVVMDVLRRYDVDAIHMDDYFYPYPENNAAGQPMAFPDDETWAAAQRAGVKMSREDWRRHNVNTLVQELYAKIKAEKKWVKFGLSPFGIWQPGYPKQIKGFNQHEALYADAKLWLNKGWIDYFAPQLYWQIDPPQQSYPVLLEWWDSENTLKRHLWPGSNSARVGAPAPNARTVPWPAQEIARQIEISRKYQNPGHIHWNVSSLVKNSGGLADEMKKSVYTEPALVPAMTWVDNAAPAKPTVTLAGSTARWKHKGEPVRFWAVQFKSGGKWSTLVLPGAAMEKLFERAPEVVSVAAVDRAGNLGPAAVISGPKKTAAR
ncbi:MAG TPA: family 10 glycosylhydrolase [Methylomirabilota bacterium]|nr:family 10 glycosylhydrolase [Methylomirabilota bacterium]